MKKVILAVVTTLILVNVGFSEATPESKTLAVQLLESMDMKNQLEKSLIRLTLYLQIIHQMSLACK